MKTLGIALTATALFVAACNNNKADQQKQMDEVMAIHDKVMGYDETSVKNKAQLDSLAKLPSYAVKKDSIQILSKDLAAADSAMGEWMNKFNPDFKDKSDEEVKAYLSTQKKQIMKIDTQFSKAVAQTNQFLSKINKQK